MRHVLLGAFFVLAACGGDLRGESPRAVDPGADARQERAAFLLTSAAQSAISDIARSADQDALESCINRWVDDLGPTGPNEGPVQKPDVAGLRAFLVQCLAGNVPGDVRASGAHGDARISRAGEARALSDK